MNEMAERVARALHLAVGTQPWEDVKDGAYRNVRLQQARAAIEAVRETMPADVAKAFDEALK